MNDLPKDSPSPRWVTLSREVQWMKDSLNTFTLVGVEDREGNHIASMQEEIDQKIREALVVYWLTTSPGRQIPGDIDSDLS